MKRSTPEQQGIPTSVIDRFIAALNDQATNAATAVHSVAIARNGYLIGEASWHPYTSNSPHMLYSLSKSFTSTAVGLAVFEGKLSIDDLVIDLLPDDLPAEISPHLAAMRVCDLLTMTTGHAVDTMPPHTAVGPNWARSILAQPVEFPPGTHFVYNSGATYLLAAILTRITGERMLDYLTPRLLSPLGIVGATWEQCPRGIDVGGWGLSISTRDITVFGQLLLDRGVFGGRQLVPAEWIDAATSAQVSNGDPAVPDDSTQGYGYQFWRSQHSAYRADGAFGQMCIVIPEHNTVVAFTSGHHNAQKLRDILWDTLLPGRGAAAAHTSTEIGAPDGGPRYGFELPHPHGEPPTGAGENGAQAGGTWTLDDNPLGITTLSLGTDDRTTEVTFTVDGSEFAIQCGYREWTAGRIPAGLVLPGLTRVASEGGPIAASGAWVGTTFTAVIWFTEAPYAQTITATVNDESLTVVTYPNVSFADPVEPLSIAGRRS